MTNDEDQRDVDAHDGAYVVCPRSPSGSWAMGSTARRAWHTLQLLGYNRLVRQEGGFALTHFENPDMIPYDPVDTTVGVIRVTDLQDQVRAVLVNYACHPVVLGPRNRKISADYPGVLSVLEQIYTLQGRLRSEPVRHTNE